MIAYSTTDNCMCTPSEQLNSRRVQSVLLPGLSCTYKNVTIVAKGCRLHVRTVLVHIDPEGFLQLTCPIYTLVAHFASGKWFGTDSTVLFQHLLVIISHPKEINSFLYQLQCTLLCVYILGYCVQEKRGSYIFLLQVCTTTLTNYFEDLLVLRKTP